MDDAVRVSLIELPAVEIRDRVAAGSLSAVEVAQACLARIAAREDEIGAWEWHDAEFVLDQARRLDAYRATGRPLGPLHGLPVGLKDIIDTKAIPTQNGTPIDKGRVPERDAWIVGRLRAAGAVLMGKTVTTELAFKHPGRTRNPRNTAHTPGGSSSGSAAAVADRMVPLAIGTQTTGSVIRPAAFCGVTGFKPTFGAIPRSGVLLQSQSLDTLGVFGAGPRDAALIADALFGHDPGDTATAPAPHPGLLATASDKPPVKPVFALIRPPGWSEAHPDTAAALDELAGALTEEQCYEFELPEIFAEAAAIHRRINFAEMARNYHAYARRGGDLLSPETRDALEEGRAVSAVDYIAALEWIEVLYAGLDRILQRCDAILAPAAPGPAPEGLASTGDPIFNGLWTLCRMPAVAVPIFEAGNGLPMAAQLVGARGHDGRLLRTAQWLVDFTSGVGEGER